MKRKRKRKKAPQVGLSHEQLVKVLLDPRVQVVVGHHLASVLQAAA